MREHYTNVNPNKLHDELIAAGIIPLLVENDCPEDGYIAPNTWITFPDGTDMEKVAQIVSAHNPNPKPQPPTEAERIAALEEAILVLMGV